MRFTNDENACKGDGSKVIWKISTVLHAKKKQKTFQIVILKTKPRKKAEDPKRKLYDEIR